MPFCAAQACGPAGTGLDEIDFELIELLEIRNIIEPQEIRLTRWEVS